MAKMKLLGFIFLATFLAGFSFTESSSGGKDFDVRNHIGTSSRYVVADKKTSENAGGLEKSPHSGCVPIHLNLVARHGTRSPTQKSVKELEKFSKQLESLLKVLELKEKNKVPSWIQGWKPPWDKIKTAGHLTVEGEEELYLLGKRTRERFPDLFKEDYHPDVYVISATQVPRASASAVAFGMGLFSGKGTLGEGKQRAFAVVSDTRANDIHLRFHDTCQSYKAFKKTRKPDVARIQGPVYDEISHSLVDRYKINFSKKDVSSLWFLCKQEAALLNRTDQACGLFLPNEIELLEWADDLELYYLKGYGESLNYRMGVPLLQNVMQSMELAIQNEQAGMQKQTIIEKARLRFAHAETVIPFTCLLGLFLNPLDLESIQKEKPLEQPPRPPQQRRWRGSTVAPFAANNMLVLYKCPLEVETAEKSERPENGFFVEILHNEEPTSIPGCDGKSFCPFEIFKEKVVGPHLKHSFESLCTMKVVPKSYSIGSMISRFFNQFSKNQKPKDSEVDDEL